MIDASQGRLQLDGHDLVIGPGVSEAEFLDSTVGKAASLLVDNEPYRSWNLKGISLNGLPIAANLYFRNHKLWQVTMALYDARFGLSSNDWTPEKEDQHRQALDSWLQQYFPNKRNFSWGEVTNAHDTKNATWSICIVYGQAQR
jgi:hypothetical protein